MRVVGGVRNSHNNEKCEKHGKNVFCDVSAARKTDACCRDSARMAHFLPFGRGDFVRLRAVLGAGLDEIRGGFVIYGENRFLQTVELRFRIPAGGRCRDSGIGGPEKTLRVRPCGGVFGVNVFGCVRIHMFAQPRAVFRMALEKQLGTSALDPVPACNMRSFTLFV